MPDPITYELKDLADRDLDVLIVGSGPASVAVAEHLYDQPCKPKIGILERGGILTTTHISNMLSEKVGGRLSSSVNRREQFIRAHGEFLWTGDLRRSGMMILALGGRGIVAGAQLRRFYSNDFTCWNHGEWPIRPEELTEYYTLAEVRRHVRPGDCDGSAQGWVLGQLYSFHAAPPPWGVDSPTVRNLQAGHGYDSSVGRLWMLLLEDQQTAVTEKKARRLYVATNAYALKMSCQQSRVHEVLCRDARDKTPGGTVVPLSAKLFVLAASPIESARLMLNSDLDGPCTGQFLAEHMYCRRTISVTPPPVIGDIHRLAVRVVVPPPPDDSLNTRFQIELLGEEDVDNPGKLKLRFTGEGAMQPNSDNRVTLARDHKGKPLCDSWGVPKARVALKRSHDDDTRLTVMKNAMWHVAEALGVTNSIFFSEEIEVLPAGRSHHEAGTLRMGYSDKTSVTDPNGRVHGMENLFVADASVFPCVGVANPMLTVTALGYRLAGHIAGLLSNRSYRKGAQQRAALDGWRRR